MKTLLLMILVPWIVFSQTKDIHYLVVKGKAEVQVPVEYIDISVSIITAGPSMKAANDTNRVLVFKVFDVLRHFAIPDSDFQTLDNSSNEDMYSKEPGRRFSVHYSGIVCLRKPAMYDSLFQVLVGLGNVSVGINAFRSNRHSYYRMLGYQKAVEAARREAKLMLKGSGQSSGRIIKLIQDNQDVFTQYDDIDKLLEGKNLPIGEAIMLMAARPGEEESTFRKKYFTETAEVTVIFEIN